MKTELNKSDLENLREYTIEVKNVSLEEYNKWFGGKKTYSINVIAYTMIMEERENLNKVQLKGVNQLARYARKMKHLEHEHFDKWFEKKEEFCQDILNMVDEIIEKGIDKSI